MNKEWTLTQAALDTLLAWLDPDRENAGAKYEAIRARLIKMFICWGCPEAEDLADETINRVTSKLYDMVDDYQGNPALFFYGVAKKVRLESGRRRPKPLAPPPPTETNTVELEYECLERCMQALPPDQRSLVLQYYSEDKRAKIDNRKQLAQRMGIAINALRIRAHRIRCALQQCFEACLEQNASA